MSKFVANTEKTGRDGARLPFDNFDGLDIVTDHPFSDLVEDPHTDTDDLGHDEGSPWRRLGAEDILDAGGEGEEEDQQDINYHGEDGNLEEFLG